MAIKLRKGFNPNAMKHFVLALQKRPKTVKNIAEDTGLTENTIRIWLRLFRIPEPGQPVLIHIAAWKRTTHTWTAMYMWGDEDDVLKPTPRTAAEHHRNYRQRRAIREERKQDGNSKGLGLLPR